MATDDPDEYAVGYLVVASGIPVEASDGTIVGKLDRAIEHQRENMLDGIVVRTDNGLVFVDAPEVARMTNLRVLLTIDAEAVAALPPYRG